METGLTPEISVVIPAYNAEQYLSDSVESILQQTFQRFEIIILDDCSIDSTWSIAKRFAALDSRVQAIRNQENLGIAGNRNKGRAVARGKYLAWQDADDISLPTRLEKQYQYLESHPNVGMVGGNIEIFRGDRVLGTREYPSTDAAIRACIFRYSPIAQPAAMLRLAALHSAGEYNLDYPPAEDLDMTFRIGEGFELANLADVVLRYREVPTSATFTRLRKIEKTTLEIRRKYSRSTAYRMTATDKLYNFAHFISMFILPAKIKINLFHLLRDKPVK